ncbi:MAG: hypothetical protein IKO19_01625 [Candidatus Riflebacteria bacterium]|nr:hypothetical protein [Candidatus Riflebacteria bacterium]MBR4569356.1 hypothetical protein [Candidatus Riflebacteria bacterium]
MKRIIYISLLVSSLFLLGCDENNKESASQPSQSQKSEITNNINTNDYTVLNASEGNLFGKEKSVLEKAQKDYQDSYSEYVRCLRESGPQTIETLQALAVYQKKYQIYQMLLKAESEK